MNRPTEIRRNIMLKEMDVRFLPNGNRNLFSVKFVTGSGKVHYFPYVYITGLRFNVKEHRMRGVQPCDENGNKTDHVYPVSIDAFIMFNQMEVIL